MIRLAHLSDLHLGAAEKADAEEGDPVALRLHLVERLAEEVVAAGCDGILIAGDVFDRSQPDDRPRRAFAAMLESWHEAGIPVAMIAGNHDAENGILLGMPLPPTAVLLGVQDPGTALWEDLGVAVHGRSVVRPDETRDLAAGYPAAVPGIANVGLLHTSLDGSRSRRVCAPTSMPVLDARGYDYWALGHVHERLLVDPRGSAAFAGSPRRRGGSLQGYLEVMLGAPGERPVVTPVDIRV